jgi:uncharacterized membrane protein
VIGCRQLSDDSSGSLEKSGGSPDGENSSTLARLIQVLSEASKGELDLAQLEQMPNSEEAAIAKVLLSETYRGAFPHPSVLKQLNDVIENGAERAFGMTEKEQAHRHECDTKIVDAEVEEAKARSFDRRLVIILAFVFLILSLSAATWLVVDGHAAGAGLVGGGGSLVALVGIFFGVKKTEGKAA